MAMIVLLFDSILILERSEMVMIVRTSLLLMECG